MRNYYKIMLGPKSLYVQQCLDGGFVGIDYGIKQDLISTLPEDREEFDHQLIQIYLNANPEKSKIAAGLACATIWRITYGINIGDIVLCPNGKMKFLFGEVVEDYSYHPEGILPHRRAIKWLPVIVSRLEVSQELKSATTNSQGTSVQITNCDEEIESYISGNLKSSAISNSQNIEDEAVFGLEKYLEEFLVENWASTELGKRYDIYEEDGEIVGRQYPSDTGPIDILAISKDKMELLVVELKRGKASDSVIGQIQRYMGYVKSELAEKNQSVKGVIIALGDDTRIKRALSVTNNIEFFRYQVNFKLLKVQ